MNLNIKIKLTNFHKLYETFIELIYFSYDINIKISKEIYFFKKKKIIVQLI